MIRTLIRRVCGSRKRDEARERSKAIDNQLREERKRRSTEVRLLLLGAGESGKSTFVKQMRIIHDKPFTEDERIEFRRVIHIGVIRGIQVLLLARKNLGIPFQSDLESEAEMLLMFDSYHSISPENMGDLGQLCKMMWNDFGLKETFRRRAEFQVMDSIEYFLNDVDRIGRRDYVPTDQDILFARRTTKQVTEYRVPINGVNFVFFDVGGQRTQREKWFELFSEDLSSVLFMVSASEFDQKLREDWNENRLKEAVIIFRTIVNNIYFRKTPFILFLNKMDLLKEKVETCGADISKYFEDFNDHSLVSVKGRKFTQNSGSFEDVKTFILSMFLRNVNEKVSAKGSFKKGVYHHFTIATDTHNIKFVFQSVRDSILRKNLDALMLD